MLFVCLSITSKFLNLVTDCYKSGVNIMMTLGGTATTWVLISYTQYEECGGHAKF
jgi:hypothetical protein